MLTVESGRNKSWEREVARHNSVSSLGNICGLVMNTIIASFVMINWLFYISSALCLIAVLLLWRLAKESEITLERHGFSIRGLRYAEKIISPKSVFHFFDIRRLRILKIRVFKLKSLQLLFLSCFVQWTGIAFFAIGEIPLMRNLGMADSLILALNAIASLVSFFSFSKIIPSLKYSRLKLLNVAIIWRSIFIMGWAGISLLLVYPMPYAIIFPFLLGTTWPISYAMIWLPIITYTISVSPINKKSATQGTLIATLAIANAIGSTLGGFVISTFGFTVGFISAAAIALSCIPIFSRIDIY